MTMLKANSKSLLRFRSALPWAWRHLLFSLGIVFLVGILVFFVWFPWPLMEISGGWSLLLLIFGVDVVCGPALTLLLLHPGKSRKALLVDIGLILTLQASALSYGIYSLGQARPIAVVYEVDRFRVVSVADIDTSSPEALPEWVGAWNFTPPRILGVRSAKSAEEKIESLNASLQGLETGQRPNWWQDYEISVPQVKARAKSLEQLLALNSGSVESIRENAARAAEKPRENEVLVPSELLWLPVVSKRTTGWVAFIDPNTARIRGYVRADGFGE
ncbi:hypothetical protein [Acidovorax sp. A1169]|uniref:hypothetical protein n=1 Tax=Acidovorax sp. A1169 TaxID=3059524 RepID=UPI002737CC5D|nr:hypothetical protein [Acidovorax sp. A1169]